MARERFELRSTGSACSREKLKTRHRKLYTSFLRGERKRVAGAPLSLHSLAESHVFYYQFSLRFWPPFMHLGPNEGQEILLMILTVLATCTTNNPGEPGSRWFRVPDSG